MMQFDRLTIGRQAKELGYVRDTFEKVCRLVDVLSFIGNDPALSGSLALKGGTAINLAFFDLPRLSIDIDLDYAKDMPREAMMEDRVRITDHISKYMSAAGYTLHPRSKQYHALDSFVYEYINAGGMRDNLKIEINYTTLQQSVEAYRKAYGHYPARVLADTIFRTRENLRYCKEHGIHLNGPKLGKPFADPTEARKHKKLEWLESGERGEIERNFGVGKRRYYYALT